MKPEWPRLRFKAQNLGHELKKVREDMRVLAFFADLAVRHGTGSEIVSARAESLREAVERLEKLGDELCDELDDEPHPTDDLND